MIEVLVRDARDRAVVGFEDDRDLAGVAVLEVALEAVVRDVELAVLEPLVERRVALVEHAGERLAPAERLAREVAPEALEVARGLRVHRVEIGLPDVRLRGPRRRRLEHALFAHHGLDRRHRISSKTDMARPVERRRCREVYRTLRRPPNDDRRRDARPRKRDRARRRAAFRAPLASRDGRAAWR